MAYWLLKSEPESYGIDHLAVEGVASWDGVRNYAARNNLMAMKIGDLGFFYHSSCEVPGVYGICEVVREHYPDHTQFDPASKYFDAKTSPDKPRWFMPDVGFVLKFDQAVPLAEMRRTPGLEQMQMFVYNRLSVSAVTPEEWSIICDLAGSPVDPRAVQVPEMTAAEVVPAPPESVAVEVASELSP